MNGCMLCLEAATEYLCGYVCNKHAHCSEGGCEARAANKSGLCAAHFATWHPAPQDVVAVDVPFGRFRTTEWHHWSVQAVSADGTCIGAADGEAGGIQWRLKSECRPHTTFDTPERRAYMDHLRSQFALMDAATPT